MDKQSKFVKQISPASSEEIAGDLNSSSEILLIEEDLDLMIERTFDSDTTFSSSENGLKLRPSRVLNYQLF